jgi:hypothetical protein
VCQQQQDSLAGGRTLGGPAACPTRSPHMGECCCQLQRWSAYRQHPRSTGSLVVWPSPHPMCMGHAAATANAPAAACRYRPEWHRVCHIKEGTGGGRRTLATDIQQQASSLPAHKSQVQPHLSSYGSKDAQDSCCQWSVVTHTTATIPLSPLQPHHRKQIHQHKQPTQPNTTGAQQHGHPRPRQPLPTSHSEHLTSNQVPAAAAAAAAEGSTAAPGTPQKQPNIHARPAGRYIYMLDHSRGRWPIHTSAACMLGGLGPGCRCSAPLMAAGMIRRPAHTS